MRKLKTKKTKSSKSKISNSNKSNINITIHNSEKKQRRTTRKKKGTDGSYAPATQNPKGYTNTVTTGAQPVKNYQDDPKLLAQVENYNNRNLEIANVANNPLIEQVHRLEDGNNALHQEFEQFKTGIQTQGNALLHKMNVLEHHKTPLKVLDIKKKAGRPKKEAAAEEPVVKKAVGRPKKVKEPEPNDEFKAHAKLHDDLHTKAIKISPAARPKLRYAYIPSDTEDDLNTTVLKTPISHKRESMNELLNRGEMANEDNIFEQREYELDNIYSGLMKDQKNLDFKAELQQEGRRVRKPKSPYTPST